MATECKPEVLERCNLTGTSTSRNRTLSEKSDDFGEFCGDTTVKDYFETNNPFDHRRHDVQTLECCFCRVKSPPTLTDGSSETPFSQNFIGTNRLWEFITIGLGAIRNPTWRNSRFETQHISSLRLSESQVSSRRVTMDSKAYRRIFDFHSMFKRTHRKTSSLSDSTFLRTLTVPQDSLGREKRSLSAHDLNKDIQKSPVGPRSSQVLSKTEQVIKNMDALNIEERSQMHSRSPSMSSFDECRAAQGLLALSLKELQQLQEELAAYVKDFSDVLVKELTRRDEQIREKEVKNRFISSLLTVQNRIRECGSKKGKGGMILPNSLIKSKYLCTVIPYQEEHGGPSNEVLERLIEIMNAMSSDSSTVPSLLTEYILNVLCV